ADSAIGSRCRRTRSGRGRSLAKSSRNRTSDRPGTDSMPPLFISLDGLDGTGKSTQCRLLADWLRGRGYAVTEAVEPGSTPIGVELRALLLGHRHDLALRTEALLFMAARAELV